MAGAYTGNIKAHATANPGGTKTPNDGQGTDMTINVTQPPTITSANNTTFTVGTAGTFTVTATGAPSWWQLALAAAGVVLTYRGTVHPAIVIAIGAGVGLVLGR